MSKNAVLVMVLTLLLTTLLTSGSKIQSSEASGTIYIRADGSIDPSTANITTSDNVTYTFTGNNYDEIVVERSNIVIDGSGYRLQGSGLGYGLHLVSVRNITVENMTTYDFTRGFYVDSSSFVTISGNTLSSTETGYGIYLSNSTNTTIHGNKVTGTYDGILLFRNSTGNIITENIIMNNEYVGIVLYSSSNNIVSRNWIVENNYGIFLESSSDNNTIYHNNIANNTKQVHSVDSHNNTWDNGCEGNHWDDYNGTDSDGNGIGDTPYTIDEDNTDRFPLMNLYWNPCDINHDLKVDMEDIGTSARAFGTEAGDERWNCHADITGPIPLEPDGKVNMRDIGLIARNFGETYP